MFGATTRDYIYMRCDYGRQYGRAEADRIPGHGQWCSVREDMLLPLVLDFFGQRVFGKLRLDLLADQLGAHECSDPDHNTRVRLEDQVSKTDAAIAAQVCAIEAGVDPTVVGARIEELKAARASDEAALAALARPAATDHARLMENLGALPDLTVALRRAAPAVQRAVFDAFDLRVEYNRVQSVATISATVDESVANGLGGLTSLPAEICTIGHGGGRIRTCEG